MVAAIALAVAAAIVIDATPVGVGREEYIPEPVDPSMLAPPDVAHWRASLLPVGNLAPGFCLPDVVTGERVALDQFRGRPVVLLISSFGCNVFCTELGSLIDLYRRYHDEVVFLFIAIRDAGHPDPSYSPPPGQPRPGETPDETRLRLVRDGVVFLKLPFPTLLDEGGTVEAAYNAFPKRLVVIRADGQIHYDGGRGASGGPSAWDLDAIEQHLRTAR